MKIDMPIGTTIQSQIDANTLREINKGTYIQVGSQILKVDAIEEYETEPTQLLCYENIPAKSNDINCPLCGNQLQLDTHKCEACGCMLTIDTLCFCDIIKFGNKEKFSDIENMKDILSGNGKLQLKYIEVCPMCDNTINYNQLKVEVKCNKCNTEFIFNDVIYKKNISTTYTVKILNYLDKSPNLEFDDIMRKNPILVKLVIV